MVVFSHNPRLLRRMKQEDDFKFLASLDYIIRLCLSNKKLPGMVAVHSFYPSTLKTGTGGCLSSSPAWSIELVPEQSGLHKESQAIDTHVFKSSIW